jgi:hypothetical protein
VTWILAGITTPAAAGWKLGAVGESCTQTCGGTCNTASQNLLSSVGAVHAVVDICLNYVQRTCQTFFADPANSATPSFSTSTNENCLLSTRTQPAMAQQASSVPCVDVEHVLAPPLFLSAPLAGSSEEQRNHAWMFAHIRNSTLDQ